MDKKQNYSLRCVFPSLPKVERGKFVNLGGDPKGKNILYCNGYNVHIRDVEDCTKCDIYSDHQQPVTVAKYSPSGFYIASGDMSGTVRIWDTINPDHKLKNEYGVLGGPVRDIAWSPDSQKICVVGEGRELYSKVITADSGNTVGDMSGHCKHVNAAAYRPDRPFRICTVSEDQDARFYKGLPFKLEKSMNEHSNFVNCVKYHPKGDVFITGGADGQAFVYDGETAVLKGALGAPKAHQGGIYGLDFSPDGCEVLTVSGDKSAKIWNVDKKELVTEFKFGNDIHDMMLGCVWQGDNILALALSGYIIYLDKNNPAEPRKFLKGHFRPIISMAATPDLSNIYTGSTDGQIYGWDVNTGLCDLIKGKGHENQVQDMAIVADTLVTVGIDDVIRYTQLEGIKSNQYRGGACKLPSQPRAVASKEAGLSVVACLHHIVLVEKCQIVFQQQVEFEPTCVDIHPNGGVVAIGTSTNHSIYIYDIVDNTLTNLRKHPVEDTVVCVKFSPNGQFLTATTGTRHRVVLLRFGEELKEVYALTKQTGKLFSLAWCPDSQYFATGSLDGSIVVWRLDRQYDANCVVIIKGAHPKSHITKLLWLSNNTIVSSGGDANIKCWDVKLD